MNLNIRLEGAANRAGIWSVHAGAFPTHGEADLVNRLRDDGDVVYSLLADHDGAVVGHALLSKMRAPQGFLGLGPVAVVASYRRQGIAARLVQEGLARATRDGWQGVFVLGGDYYRRFGFDPALTAGFDSPYAGPHLMALSLRPEGMTIHSGSANYARAFSEPPGN